MMKKGIHRFKNILLQTVVAIKEVQNCRMGDFMGFLIE